MAGRPRVPVLAAAAGALLAACSGDRAAPPIPELRAPSPIPHAYRAPLPAPFGVRLSGVRYVTELGAEVVIPRAEAVYIFATEPPREDGPVVHVRELRLFEPRVTFPVDTIVTGVNLFFPLLGPRAAVDRLMVEGGEVGTLAHPTQYAGRWLWRMESVDLVVEDVEVGGADGVVEGFRLVDASGSGEVRGRPLRIEAASGRIERTYDLLTFSAAADLGLTRLSASGAVRRTPGWSIDLRADTLSFAELRAVVRPLPKVGTGELALAIRGEDGRTTYTFERFDAVVGASQLALRGSIVAAEEPVLDALTLMLVRLRAEDLEALIAAGVPVDGVWTGELRADGGFRRGVRLRGALDHRADGGERSRLSVDGLVRVQPEARLELNVAATPVRFADTAFVAALVGRGRPDSLRVQGTAALLESGAVRELPRLVASLDALLLDPSGGPPRLTGRALVRSVPESGSSTAAENEPGVRATAVGSVVLAPGGPVAARVTADELPLAVFPAPPTIEDIEGSIAGTLVIAGALEAPAIRGRFRLRDGGFRAPPIGLVVEGVSGPIRLDRRGVVLDRLAGRAGGGTLELSGRVRFAGPDRLDLVFVADRARLIDHEDARVVASAELRVRGGLDRPRVTGRAELVEGVVREDVFRPAGPLDLESPPYTALVLDVPWPADSRLRSAALAAQRRRAPPVVGEVVVDVRPGLLVVDEDSELFGAGRVRVSADDEGLGARGTVRVLGGFYNLFGERFRVFGGALRFRGEALEPFVTVLAEHQLDGSLWGLWGVGTVSDRTPPVELFARGPTAAVVENARRAALLPESQPELAELLIYGVEPQPVTGWRSPLLWRPDGAEVFGERAEAQGGALLWSYIADEAYDYLPLDRGYLEGGIIAVGSRYPARLVVGPLLQATAVLDETAEVEASQPLDGGVAPGVRARLGLSPLVLELFNEPRFFAAAAAGEGHPGFFHRRSTGITVRWTIE